MAPLTKIQVDITTGNQDPDSNTRIFLGFDPRNVQANATRFGGREFRLRKGNDANPFRGGPEQLIFGIGNNVKNPELNDPQTPYPLESDDIAGVYIRVSPLSKESWSINSAIVQLFEGSPPTPVAGRRYDLPQGASIILQEDGAEKVYLRRPDPPQLEGIEVTQANQTLDNAVPLIAGKATVARVYLSCYQAPGMTVRGILRAQRLGTLPVAVTSVADTFLDATNAGNPNAMRRDMNLSLNFVLPAALLAEGPLSLSLDSLIDTATGTLLQVAFNSPSTVHFGASHPLRIRVLTVRYNQQVNPPPAPPSTFVATASDLQNLRSWLGRAYPVADVVWSSGTIDANMQGPNFTSGDINAQLAAIRAQDVAAGVDKRTHYYGMVADGGFFMRGSAAGIPGTPDPSVVASGPTGPNSWGWDLDGSYGDWYGGHELGHTFGRFHPGSGCGESSDDPNYPYTQGQLANNDAGCVGFDVGDAALGIAIAAYPGTAWHDVMTYCNNQWLSDYTYNSIGTRLAAEDALPAGPVLAHLPVEEGVASGRPDERVPEIPAVEAKGAGRMLIHVVATVNLTRRQGKIEYVNPLSAGDASGLKPGSQVQIRVLSADETLLREYPVEVKLNSELGPEDDKEGLIDAALAVDPAARVVQLAIAGGIADTFRAAAQAPSGGVSSRVKVEKAAVHLSWQPGPTVEAKHTYTIQASTDGGQTWYTLGVGLTEPSIRIHKGQFEAGREVRLRVLATDGFTQLVVASEKFTA
jgi:hypothetical protein